MSAAETIELYSLPRPGRRPPGDKPRLRGRSMTIAAGFRCSDGVVLCTDSEHTEGQVKFYDRKIFDTYSNNAIVCVAGAGDSEYIKSAAQDIETKIKNRNVSLDQIKACVEEVLEEIYNMRIVPALQAGDPNAPSFTLLLAEQIDHETAKLFKVRENGSIVELASGFSLSGVETAESVLRAIANIFTADGDTSVHAMRAIAVHLIHCAVRFATYCGGSPQIVCLADNGSRFIDISPGPSLGTDPLATIFSSVPCLVETYASADKEMLFECVLPLINQDLSQIMDEKIERQKKRKESPFRPEGAEWVW